MKAAVLGALGAPPACGAFRAPELQAGECRVWVTAAAIKHLERAIAAGTHYASPDQLPIVPGLDGVGRLDDGARVYFVVQRRPFGAMAAQAPAAWTVPVPDALDDATAAAVVNPALAAWLPLHERARLVPGETVLVLGASGTAGQMAVTLARQLGARRVVACGRRMAVLERLAADAIIDLDLPDAELSRAFAAEARRGLGVIVDYLWGRPAELLIGQLAQSDLSPAPDGRAIRFVCVGAMAGPTVQLASGVLRGSRLEITGSGTGNFPDAAAMAAATARVFDLALAGHLPIRVQTAPLEDVARVWDLDTPGLRWVLTP